MEITEKLIKETANTLMDKISNKVGLLTTEQVEAYNAGVKELGKELISFFRLEVSDEKECDQCKENEPELCPKHLAEKKNV